MIDVHKVASLARLVISPEEAAEFQKQMAAIFDNFEKIKAVDTTGVEPLVTPSEIEMVLRDDSLEAQEEKITVEEALKNAPERSGNLFKVPPVVG